jgi:UDP-2,4-diacetamido-2,4,6-trideoxy-beta-L-altropyranose hydrolase/UDP-4-amino-4,6-dideoxy-N-acetyl-beta-L-altrosamine N-acetyltransferase
MKVVFRVDASLKMGTGHVMRCLTLAQVLKENSVNVEFICRQHEGSLNNKISSIGFNVYELELLEKSEVDNKLLHSHWLGVTQQQDANDCINILKSEKTDWLIVDHYALDEDWQCKLKPFYEKIMVIDDLADRKHQCDILLDQTFGRQQKDYLALVPKDCAILLGSQYALLRPEFAKWRAYSIERRSKLEFRRLLINMGGVDVDNVTGKVLQELSTCHLPNDINITIIMGKSAPHLEDVRAIARILPCKAEVKIDVDNMAEIMANTDMAIGAAGTTTWERCCLALPTIQIIIAKNQIFSAETLARHNAVKLLKEVKDVGQLLKNSTEWMDDIGNAASQTCDGMGVYKIFSKMTDYKITIEDIGEVTLCNYANLNLYDKNLALNMRNHPEIKKWMSNQYDISKESHLSFIQNLKSNIEQRYFLVKQSKQVVGSINFSQIDSHNSVEFGLYTNPFEQVKGTGRILEAAASHYAFVELGVKKIKLKVFSCNVRAINFYKKNGFEQVAIEKVNNKDMLYMQKKTLTKVYE